MEKKKRFIISAVYYLIIAAIVFLVFKYAVFMVMPFLIGFTIAAVLNPAVRFFVGRFDMKRKPTAILILLLFYATIGMLATVGVVRLTVWIGEFSGKLPEIYSSSIEPALNGLLEWINSIAAKADASKGGSFAMGVSDILASVKSSLFTAVSDISVRALSFLSGFAAGIPGFIIEVMFSVISAFFFIIDYEKIIGYAKARLPRRTVGLMRDIRDRFFSVIVRYLRSYTIILLITFAELFVGFVLIGTENALWYALLIALCDMLPVIGTGTAIIPWAAVELIRGNMGYGVGLLVIWGITGIVRSVIEPRIVGRQMGVHPLISLITMFVGTKLFGFVGFVILPISLPIVASVVRERLQSSSEVRS